MQKIKIDGTNLQNIESVNCMIFKKILHRIEGLPFLHEIKMESTNIEEENSDAAAYGLVALCDSNFDGTDSQISEETVETSEQIASAINPTGNPVQFFEIPPQIQDEQQQLQIEDSHQQHTIILQQEDAADVNQNNTEVEEVSMEETDNSELLKFDASTIAFVQQQVSDGNVVGEEGSSEIDIQSLQAVAEAMEKSGVKVKVESKYDMAVTL